MEQCSKPVKAMKAMKAMKRGMKAMKKKKASGATRLQRRRTITDDWAFEALQLGITDSHEHAVDRAEDIRAKTSRSGRATRKRPSSELPIFPVPSTINKFPTKKELIHAFQTRLSSITGSASKAPPTQKKSMASSSAASSSKRATESPEPDSSSRYDYSFDK